MKRRFVLLKMIIQECRTDVKMYLHRVTVCLISLPHTVYRLLTPCSALKMDVYKNEL